MNGPILVIPDNDFNVSYPVVIGTNVRRPCKYFIQNSDVETEDIPKQWTLAMQGIISNSFRVRACSHKPFTVGPYEPITVNGIARDLNSNISSVITESSRCWDMSFVQKLLK